MSEETKNQDPNANTDEKDQVIAKLQEQVENLNKGIAATRDEAKSATEAAKQATEALAKYEQARDSGKKEEIELSPEDEKKFKAWAKANGVVTQQELEAERQKMAQSSQQNVQTQAVDEFLKKYPEYDDDEHWQKVQAEFNLYKTPTDITGYRKLLEKIHKDLGGDSKDDDARAKVRADISRKEALTRGGKGAGAKDASRESRIEEMMEKYPSLSRQQIEARLAEIDEMFPKDKK